MLPEGRGTACLQTISALPTTDYLDLVYSVNQVMKCLGCIVLYYLLFVEILETTVYIQHVRKCVSRSDFKVSYH